MRLVVMSARFAPVWNRESRFTSPLVPLRRYASIEATYVVTRSRGASSSASVLPTKPEMPISQVNQLP
jgi:hypothetical protein